MKKELRIDGKQYVTTREAAEFLGYAPDYISRLCREGKLSGIRRDTSWVVEAGALLPFLRTHEARKTIWHTNLSHELKSVSVPISATLFETSLYAHRNSDLRIKVAPKQLWKHLWFQEEKVRSRQRMRVRLSTTAFVCALLFLISANADQLGIRTLAENFIRFSSADRKEQAAALSSLGSFIDDTAATVYQYATNAACNITGWCDEPQHYVVYIRGNPRRPETISDSTNQEPVKPVTQTIVYQPIVERLRETVRTVVEEGINVAYVDGKISALEGALSNRISAVNTSASTQITNVYNAAASAARIEHLDDLDLTDPKITRGTITNATISSLSSPLSISDGGTGTSSAPTSGKILVGNSAGSYDYLATSSLGITSESQFGKAFEISNGALAPTTTLGILISASSSFNGGISINNATTTNATSTNLFSTLGRFTNGVFDTLITAAAATVTNLTATTLTATNATTTRIDALEYVAVGRTATTTIRGDGVASTIPYASSTAVTVSGTSFLSNLLATASSTIGNGTQAGGLTISGGATTTQALVVQGTSASSTFAGNVEILGRLKIGSGSIYLNGAATSTYSSGIQSSALDLLSGGALTINGTNVLNATTLGSGVTASSLTSVSTITSGTWTGTTIALANGGTGATTAAGARTNLGVTATGADTTYAFRANNLSDLGSAATARTNLGVTATGADTTYAFRANNLSDLGSAATARTNLGLSATGSTLVKDHSGSYTSLNVSGTNGGYAGINFESVTGNGQLLMVGDANDVQGFYKDGVGWSWYFQSGALTAGTVPVGRITGTLPVANGGTGATSQTSNGINYYNGTSITSGTIMKFDGTNVGINQTPATNERLAVTNNAGYAIHGSDSGTASVAIRATQTGGGTSYGFIGENTGGDSSSWGIYCVGSTGSCGGDHVWTNASDARLKTDIHTLTATNGLDAIMQLRPITYHWRDYKMDVNGEQFGFLAQEVEPIFPSFVTTHGTTTILNADGTTTDVPQTKSLSYASFVVPLVKAVQELNLKLEDLATTTPKIDSESFANRFFGTLKAKLIAWFSDSKNGIASFFAKEIRAENVFADTVRARKLCLDEVCVTESELQELLDMRGHTAGAAAASGSGGENSSHTPEPEPEPTDNATTTPEARQPENESPIDEPPAETPPAAEPSSETPTPEPAPPPGTQGEDGLPSAE